MKKRSIRAFRKGIRALERQVELSLQSQTECCGVTPAQCHLLLAVEEVGEASPGDLARELELDASTLSRTVDGLAKAGLLSRREDPGNRRRQLIALTEAGMRKADEINGRCDEYYAGVLTSLGERDAAAVERAVPILVEALRSWRAEKEEGDEHAATRCCAPR